MLVSGIEILIIIVMISIFAAAFGAILLGIVKGRGGLAMVSGAVAIMGLLFAAGLLFALVGTRSLMPRVHHDATNTYPVEAADWNFDHVPGSKVSNALAGAPGNVQTSWDISLTPLLFVGCGVVALLVLALRRGFGHSCAAGHGRIWPAFLALPVIALSMFGSVRYRTSQDGSQRAAENHARRKPD